VAHLIVGELFTLYRFRVNRLLVELSKAMDLSLDNVPTLPGKTLVALDESGSMDSSYLNERSLGKTPVRISARQIGAIFACALVKKNYCDLIGFSEWAYYVNVDPSNSILGMVASIPIISGGTNFNSIFQTANQPYDRIIILSDMQAWVGYTTPKESFKEYKQRTGANPYLYCFNLVGYGDTQFPANKVYQLAGFSDKVFDTMKLLETDREALVHEIEALEL
jgi:60 kDa SS-A/Ro ribonucleoprotein